MEKCVQPSSYTHNYQYKFKYQALSAISRRLDLIKNESFAILSPLGPEGALFQHSVEVPQLKSEPLKDLRSALKASFEDLIIK